jgi:hypothetical protein
MKHPTLKRIETKIKKIKRALAAMGEMRPGSLTLQRRKGCSQGGYYQLSYTHRMQGKTEYVRASLAPLVKRQIANFHRFRRLTDRWVRLGLVHAQVKMRLEKRRLRKKVLEAAGRK